MSKLKNERLFHLWSEAEATNNTVMLELIDEIDRLKNAQGNLWRRFRANRAHTRHVETKLSGKRFLQGQTHMRDKIVSLLRDNQMLDAAELASKAFIDDPNQEQ